MRITVFLNGTTDAYGWLYDKIKTLQITPGQLALEPCSGGIVVTDPNSGDVLACVSYPGYDNNRLANTMDSAYYNQLIPDVQIFSNRATQEKTAPGSTFKMISATAGLEEGYIDAYTTTYCSGSFNTVTRVRNVGSIREVTGVECCSIIAAFLQRLLLSTGIQYGNRFQWKL